MTSLDAETDSKSTIIIIIIKVRFGVRERHGGPKNEGKEYYTVLNVFSSLCSLTLFHSN